MKKILFSITTVFIIALMGIFVANCAGFVADTLKDSRESLVFQGSTTDITNTINAQRKLHNLPELKENTTLNIIAEEKCDDMVARNYFEHIDPDGNSVYPLFKKHNITYSYAGENIAMGQVSAMQVAKEWYESPSHQANILSPSYSEVGHAICGSDGTYKIVQLFKGDYGSN